MNAQHLGRAAALFALVGLAGCGERRGTVVTQFPRWNHEQYKRIAVLPGRATTPQAVPDAAVMADRLTTLLAQNGAFTVLSRTDMQSVFAEQDLSRLADAVDEGTALPEGKLEIAQALVSAKITDYKLIAERERQTIPRYARDRRGYVMLDRVGRPIIVGEDTVWLYKHGAEVEGSVHVVDAATGKLLLSHSARIAPRPRVSRDVPPGHTPEEMAAEAARELAIEFYKQIAPTETRVKLKGDMLAVATDYFDGRYRTTKKLPPTNAEFLLVVRDLPPECERNEFRVALAVQEGRENLFEEQFIWSGSLGPEGVSYKVPTTALTNTGAQKFVAKLYSGKDPQPILTREFSLDKPKGD